MHSIFTRARTTSSKNLPKAPANDGTGGTDEFGRVRSRGGGGAALQNLPPPTPSKDRQYNTMTGGRRDRDRERSRGDTSFDSTLLDPNAGYGQQDGFLPTGLASTEPPDPDRGGDATAGSGQAYGYLSHGVNVVLGVEDATRLVEVLADELGRRALTTPFLFCNSALDINTANVRRLVSAFLSAVNPALAPPLTPGVRAPDVLEEATFAGPHDLGMALRWGLARIARVEAGVECRGLFAWDKYLEWRRMERESNYDKTSFTAFLQLIPQQVRSLTLMLLTLLARLLANSTSNGLTPPTLAQLFGPLLFGLGAPSSATGAGVPDSFHATYAAYLRACNGAEHLLLAFVRFQIASASPSSPPPRRLVSWVSGYPTAQPGLEAFERPRAGVKVVRALSVRRNVRMYTPDLVRTCAGWAKGPDGAGVRQSRDWARIAPEVRKGGERLEPRYSDGFRKRMDLPPTFVPQTGLVPSALSTPSSSSSSSMSANSSGTKASAMWEDFELGVGLGGRGLGLGGLGGQTEESKFRSLTDMRWGEFETLGFGDDGQTQSKLQFDLNESAKAERNTKRTTLTWADFSAAGFTRTDSSLSTTLQFAPPLESTIQQWPDASKDLHRKLKKQQNKLPPFGWDTQPVVDGREEVLEEGFLDVFCDLVYGGWMDRNETAFRECNWALVEFKSLPTSGEQAVQAQAILRSTSDPKNPSPDPRTASTLLLFEEFVPAEYRQALLQQQGSKPKLRTRLPSIPSLLSPGRNKGGKQWKQAATLNGKPYVLGATPSPRLGSGSGAGAGAGFGAATGAREAEFERMLMGGGAVTKVITLDGAARATATPVKDRGLEGSMMANRSTPNVSAVSSPPPPPLPALSAAKPDSPMSPASPAGGTTKKSRFRFPVGRENRHMIPSEYDTVDFETRLASYSDDEVSGNGAANGNGGKNAGQGKGARGRDRDDAWVDILVASSAKRMTGQDAELRPRVRSNNNGNGNGNGHGAARVLGRTGSGHSDPELASQEVERALAGVQAARQLSPPTDDDEADEVGRVRRELAREVEVRELTPEMLHRGRSRSASPQPPPSAVNDDEDEDDDEKFLSPALRELQQKKGRGYFDLHPDRRPALETQKTAATLGHGHGYPYSDERNTMYSEGDFEPSTSYNPSLGSAERLPDGDIEVPAFVDSNPSPGYHRESEHAKKDSMVLPALLSASVSSAVGGVGAGGGGPTGRTAQLIEMYREREKQGTLQPAVGPPVTPTRALPLAPLDTGVGGGVDAGVLPPTAPLMLQPKPSRLPVRSSSLQNDLSTTSTTAKKVPSALVPGAGPPSSIPMPTQGFDLDDDEDLHDLGGEVGEVDGEDGEVDEEQLMRDLNPPRPAPFVAADLGRVSPMRYVHGAPLHNVLEEGEEEE